MVEWAVLMAEHPMLPLWTDALLGDTQHLSQAEFGAYVLMLIVAWRTPGCCLPDDDRYLANVTRSGPGWKKIKQVVMPFWTRGADGKLRQKRLTQEHVVTEEKRVKQSEAGKTSARKRKERLQTIVAARLQVSDTLSTTLSTQPNGNQNSTPRPRPISIEESIPPPSLVPGDADGALLKSADQLRDRLEVKLSLGVPVIRAPLVSWMQAGASTELIEATIDDVLTRKPAGWKPDGIGYFGKAVLRAIESAKADAQTNGQPSGELTDREAKRIAMKAKSEMIAKGTYLPTVDIDDIRGMIHLGWLTAEQARKAGYAA